MTTPSKLSPHLSFFLLLASFGASTGCSDFLGIDRFGDQSSGAGDRPVDADDPAAGGSGGGGGPADDLNGSLMWWAAFGEAGMDAATAVAPLPGGVQLAGTIDGAVDFGGGAVGSAGQHAFVARFDLDGKHVWSTATSGSGSVEHVVVDTSSDEGAVMAGVFRGALTLDGEPLGAAPSAEPSLFVAWLSPDGDVARVASFPGTGSLTVSSLAIAPTKDVAVVGSIKGTLDVGAATVAGSLFESDALLVVLGDDGNPKLATNLRADGDTRDQHLSAVDYGDDGALWVGGSFRGSLQFSGTEITSVGTSDGFVARVAPDGPSEATVESHLLLGGGQSTVDVTSLVVGDGIALGGTFSDRLVLDVVELESEGDGDAFVAWLDLDLAPVWATPLGSAGPDTVGALGVDAHGHTTVTGSYSADLVADGLVVAPSNGEHDCFVAKVDGEGSIAWARAFGRQGDDRAHGVAVDEEGRALVAGRFSDGLNLDEEILKASGMQDVFVLRLDR